MMEREYFTASDAARRIPIRTAVAGTLFAMLALAVGVQAAPPTTVHPGWTVVNLRPSGFEPMVTGMGWLSDSSLVLAHWGGLHSQIHNRQFQGKVYIVKNVTGDSPSPVVSTYAENLEDPAGMVVVDDRIYVTGGEKLIELPDANKDGKAEAARAIVTIPGTHARHEFMFGAAYKDNKFWIIPSSGKDVGAGLSSWAQKNPNRGTVMSVNPTTGAYEVFAMGLRSPNGIGVGPEDELFVPDVEGNWLPANKLINIRKGRFYGFKHEPAETWDNMTPSPPAVYLPQGEVANAPGSPLYIKTGAYAGQMFVGDVVAGGIRRIFLEKIGNEFQGAVFFFSGGLEGGPNRLLWGQDGHLYVGICGQGSGWNFQKDFGLQKLKPNGKKVFEMLSVRARQGGMEIEYTDPINANAENKAKYTVRSWHYTSTSAYGGPKIDNRIHTVANVRVSQDRKKVFLETPGLAAGKVVYISLAADIASSDGDAVWTRETWYTLNALSTSQPFEATTGLPRTEQAIRKSDWERGLRVDAGEGRLSVRSASRGKASFQVRNVQGTLVAEASGEALASGISTAGWAPGVYTVLIREDGLAAHRRVLIH